MVQSLMYRPADYETGGDMDILTMCRSLGLYFSRCCFSRRCSFWKRRADSACSSLRCHSLPSSSKLQFSLPNRRSLSSRSCLSLSCSCLSFACSNLSSVTCPASLAAFPIPSALRSYAPPLYVPLVMLTEL